MERTPPPAFEARAAGSEREFVLALGGYSLEVAGASLVTHERVPVPRFNFIEVGRVGPDRQTAFFERALDHYFQRALRPTVRVPDPAPPHLDAGLRRFSFRPRPNPYTVWWAVPRAATDADPGSTVREARPDDLDEIVALWTGEREREEFRRALEVAWDRPHPGQRLRPVLVENDGRPVASGVMFEHDEVAGLHGVATVPGARGRGFASALVAFAQRSASSTSVGAISIASDAPDAGRRLRQLGFERLRSFVEYELPADAELALPDPGPAQAPRWRPPRGARD